MKEKNNNAGKFQEQARQKENMNTLKKCGKTKIKKQRQGKEFNKT